jgi:hypothetical protein
VYSNWAFQTEVCANICFGSVAQIDVFLEKYMAGGAKLKNVPG